MREIQIKDQYSKLTSIQFLRAVAAIAVVFHHSILESVHFFKLTESNPIYNISYGGSAGVDIFFVLSGFIITYISFNKSVNPIKFIKNRLVRVVPIYWLYTTLTLLTVISFTNLKRQTGISWTYILCSYFFIPCLRPSDNLVQPLLGLGWTLNYELFFYTLFAISLFFSDKLREFIVIGVILIFVSIGFYVPEKAVIFHFWSNPIVLEFACGILVAILFIKRIRIGAISKILLLVLSISIWLMSTCLFMKFVESYRILVWGLPALGLVSAIILHEKYTESDNFFRRLMVKIGDCSYSLYLLHMFVIRVITLIVKKIHAPIFLPGIIVFMIAVSILVSFLSYRYLELPLIALAKGKINKKKSDVSQKF